MTEKQHIAKMMQLLERNISEVCLFSIPGRVNLIGEHTDYSNCPVFPMAVDRKIMALAAPREDALVTLKNLDPKFESLTFTLSSEIPPYQRGSWGNYIKAGVQQLLSKDNTLLGKPHRITGFDLVVDSTLPPASGLSSSSALVVLASLALLWGHGREPKNEAERIELAETCAAAEHYTGTQGGGMDQAAILLGRSGHGMMINFNPLRYVQTPLPASHVFVVSHSGVTAPKTQRVMDAYNQRSIECALASALVSRYAASQNFFSGITCLGDLRPEITGGDREFGKQTAFEAVSTTPYRVSDLARELELPPEEIQQRWCIRRDGSLFPEPQEGFQIYKRLTHVLKEWDRVEKSHEALKTGDIAKFGEYMNESHESCRMYQEVSSKELDLLTDICRKAGAEGSRLTGAGFGGCAVSLVAKEQLEDFLAQTGKKYYLETMNLETWDHLMFPVEASQGAEWFRMDEQ